MKALKFIGFLFVLAITVSCYSQERPLSEKEWKLRCVQAKKQSEVLLSQFAQHDALVIKNYGNLFGLASFKTRYEEYKRSEYLYESRMYKMWVLQEDTSGYPFRYMHSEDADQAVKLSDSLTHFQRMREFRSLSDFRMKFDWIANYQTQDYNFIVTEYGNLDKEMNKQLNYAAHLILTDTLAQADLLQRNMSEVLFCTRLNAQTNTNLYFCLESLKTRYLENPEGSLPVAYRRYFSLYREDQARMSEPTGKVPVPDYALEQVDEPAEFPGGDKAFREYVDRSLKHSNLTLEGCGERKVQLMVSIARLGYVSDVAFPGSNPECQGIVREVMRIIKESPDWFPARKNGKTVSAVQLVEITIK